MLHFYQELYISDKLIKKRDKIIWKLKNNAGMIGVYVITLASNGKDIFDIYHSAVLMQKHYRNEDLYVIGISDGKEEAMYLISEIIKDIYKMTGSYDHIRVYLEGKECYK